MKFESIDDVVSKYPSLVILKEESRLWNLLMYMNYTNVFFRGTPVAPLMKRYNLTREDMIVLADALGYDIYDSTIGENYLVERKCYVSLPKITGTNYAMDSTNHAIACGMPAGSVLHAAQHAGYAPISLAGQEPCVLVSVTKEILGMSDGSISILELADCSRQNFYSVNIIESEFFYCEKTRDSYRIDPNNFLIPCESELERLKLTANKQSITMLSQMFAIPESIIRLLLNSRVTMESLSEIKERVGAKSMHNKVFKEGLTA